MRGIRQIIKKQKKSGLNYATDIEKTKICHRPNLNIDDFTHLKVKKRNQPTSEELQDFVKPKSIEREPSEPDESDEIDFTKEFEEIFENSRKSFTSQSSQESVSPNKRAKLSQPTKSQEKEETMDVDAQLFTNTALNGIDSFMDCEPVTSTQADIFNTQAALGNINDFFNNESQSKIQESSKTSKEKLADNFTKAWSKPQVKETPKPNIAKLKPAQVALSNPWATTGSKSQQNQFVPSKSKKDAEEKVPKKSIPWSSKPLDKNTLKNTFIVQRKQEQPSVPEKQKPNAENSIKNIFNSNIRHHDPPQQVPGKEEEKNPFSSFKTGRQVLSLQEANKNIRPQGLSRKHSSQSDPLRRKFQIPFKTESSINSNDTNDYDTDNFDHPLLKGFDKALLEKIKRDIVAIKSSQPVTWDDIAGLNNVKDLIRHSIIIPTLNPDVCGGLRRPPRAFLLFGPPGTGKTLIGKCIANEVDATFMSISASTLTSKWIGESETLVRAMFAYAKVLQPCVIFFDEVDSLLGKRDADGGSGNESMNRLKTEFLVQLDGANALDDSDRVILIGATNRPHAIDEAMIRRFTRRIMIPTPNAKARGKLIENLLETSGENHTLTEEEFQVLADKTEGYSGADLKNLAVEASHIPFRKAVKIHGINVTRENVRLNNFIN